MLDEWTLLAGRPVHDRLAPDAPTAARPWPPPAWRTAVRTAAFGWVELLATRSYGALADRSGWSEDQLAEAMAPYWAEYDGIAIDAPARGAQHITVTEHALRWVITQHLVDPEGDGEWRFVAVVDLETARAEGAPTLQLDQLGPF